MTATHTSTRHASYARPFGRFIAIALFTLTLITTGCDFVDSNAVMDEPHVQARLLEVSSASTQAASEEDPWVGPPYIVPFWHDLVGTWQYVEAGVVSDKTITFTSDQRIRVETVCMSHEGPFSSASQGELTIAYLALIENRCGLLAEDPLIRMLEAATHYKIRGTQLAIGSTQSAHMLGFSAAGSNAPEESFRRGKDDDGIYVGPPYGTPGAGPSDDDDDPFVGPPYGTPGETDDEGANKDTEEEG